MLIVKIIHKIKIKLNKDIAKASNDTKKHKTIITIFLEGFFYRKNISYKKVARDTDYFFLIELICSITRRWNKENDPLCGWDYKKYIRGCPCDKCMKFMGF